MLEYIKRFAEGWDAPPRAGRERARESAFARNDRSCTTHPIVRLETRERLETRD